MKSSTSFRFSSAFCFFFFLFIAAAIAEEYSSTEEDSTATYLQADECMYALSVKTGTVENAGTDSRISISMSGKGRSSVTVSSLRNWGVMRPGHDYFENGNLDFFVGKRPCLPTNNLCRITVTSDGTGNKPGWFLEYVDITTTGPNRPRVRTMFRVNQWLASSAPYKLSITVNKCNGRGGGEELDDDIATVNTVRTDFDDR